MRLTIGNRYRAQLEEAMDTCNLEVLWLPDNPDIDERLAGHADLSVFSTESTVITTKWIYPNIVNYLTSDITVFTSTREQDKTYPGDASLCVCYTGEYLIFNPKTADPAILKHAHGITVPVNQGYTKCSVCVVSKTAIITSDRGIASGASQAGMDVLEISPGYIELCGFDYGFIGGASFPLDKNKLAFTGTLADHPDKDRILAFLEKYCLEPVFLTNKPIFDIGGAVALP